MRCSLETIKKAVDKFSDAEVREMLAKVCHVVANAGGDDAYCYERGHVEWSDGLEAVYRVVAKVKGLK